MDSEELVQEHAQQMGKGNAIGGCMARLNRLEHERLARFRKRIEEDYTEGGERGRRVTDTILKTLGYVWDGRKYKRIEVDSRWKY